MPQLNPQLRESLVGQEFELSAVFEKAALPDSTDASAGLDEYVDISGFASTNTMDRQGDIIPTSTWQDPDALKNYMKNPIVLAYHDHEEPIGSVTNLEIRDAGVYVTARIYKAANSEVFSMVKAGVLKTFSIGFRLKDLDYDEELNAWILTKIEMYELSVVSVPANQDALFSIVKQLKAAGHSNDLTNKRQESKMPTPNQNTTELSQEELVAKAVTAALAQKEAEAKAKAEAEAKAKADAEALAATVLVQVKSQTDALVADIKKSLEDQTKPFSETVAQFKTEIEAKAAELTAATARGGKMEYNGTKANGPVSKEERENAVLLATLMGKKIEDTAYGKNLRQKAAGFNTSNTQVHIPGDHTVNNADWETEFSTSFWMDVRRDLVIEQMFRTISMNTASMRLPVVPDQGYANYIAVDNLKGPNSTAAVNGGSRPTEITLIAHKLSAADRIGIEETEDTILPILGLIRDNLMRRMSRSSDRSLLRGVGTTAADPIKGLAQYALDAANNYDLSIGGGDKFTALHLQKARRQLGVFGLRPRDIAYVLSTDAYYDLLEDPDMRKYFDVGPADATILNGQVASVNGTPIILSDEFAAKGVHATAGLVVNMRNFVVGNLRNITLRTDTEVASDSTLLVATRRFGMVEMEAGAVAAIQWVA